METINKRIYLDNASTTPTDNKVVSSMLPYFSDYYGNASSLHTEGRIARSATEKSRQSIAKILNANKDEIIFTSGGTESDNLAILGIARSYRQKGNHIIVSCIEHKAILNACKQLEKEGFEITYLDVNTDGIISLEQLESALRPDTILVSIMYANNEVGSIQPIKQIAKIIKALPAYSPIFHTDACQAVGALSINVAELGVDAMTISGSKIYGPKGVGCLYLNSNFTLSPIVFGGKQENSYRPGTENVAAIVGFAKALNISEDKRTNEYKRLLLLREYLFTNISKSINGISLNGGIKNRLPNNLNISVKGVEGESLVLMLDSMGIACSTGSACSSKDLQPSHVLLQIGIPLELAHCSIRFSLGRHTTKNNIDYAIKALSKCVETIRKMSSLS